MLDKTAGRKIIHIDMDCFYAAVEVRDNPALQGKPVAIGGTPDARGVVATCSYEARRFGVHSAMPMSVALRKCPELIIIQSRMPMYQQVSEGIRDVFMEYTDQVEPLSWDEAYLDVTASRSYQGSATRIAQAVRQHIVKAFGLTASAGVAPNKFLAKVASDWHKPDGLFVIHPRQVKQFMLSLPIQHIPGVGRVTALKLKRMGVSHCGQLQRFSIDELETTFGRFGHRLYELARGWDTRGVEVSNIRKSLSVEDTFRDDLLSLDACLEALPVLYELFLQRLKQAQQQQYQRPKALFVKMRFHDFVTTTAQTATTHTDVGAFQLLIKQAWDRGQRPVRLLGMGVQFDEPGTPEQMELQWSSRNVDQ